MKDVYDRLFDGIKSLQVIDTHEHLPYREAAREKHTDILREYTSHYFCRDLISAGMKYQELDMLRDISQPLMKRWELVSHHWENARNTGYGRALDITVKELYGVDGINKKTIEYLDDTFKKTLNGGQFKKVLKEKSNIIVSLLDENIDCDREYFRSVYKFDYMIFPTRGDDISRVERGSGIRITCFDDWLDSMDIILDDVYKKGVVALKSALAYKRSLYYSRASYAQAEEAFNKILESKRYIELDDYSFSTDKAFADYTMHHLLKEANKRNLTFQFHTGLQEGNGNIISNSDPSLMSELFMEYPDIRFDLFHISYPYQNIAAALAKNFQNVFIDMCWAHIISPNACIMALDEWLDVLPVNKISAFGGDYLFVDAVCGHMVIAKQNVCRVLAKKITEGIFDEDRALQIASMLFYNNPKDIFKLDFLNGENTL